MQPLSCIERNGYVATSGIEELNGKTLDKVSADLTLKNLFLPHSLSDDILGCLISGMSFGGVEAGQNSLPYLRSKWIGALISKSHLGQGVLTFKFGTGGQGAWMSDSFDMSYPYPMRVLCVAKACQQWVFVFLFNWRCLQKVSCDAILHKR
jgi:hypothetical protein